MLGEIVERVQRRLGVARPGERTREIARLVAQAPGVLLEKGFEQAQQGAPALHRPAKIVHRLGLGPGRILDGGTRLGENVVRHAAQRLPHRHARPQGGSVIHMKNIGHSCVPWRPGRHLGFSSRVTIAT